MAAPTTVLTVIKAFAYRTNPAEEWSNRYMFDGATPVDAAAWRVLFNAVAAEEVKLFASGTNVIKGYGHNSVDPHADAVWSVDLRVAPNTVMGGSYNNVGNWNLSGDSAAWVRWGMDRMVNGKRVYLRKYFHPAFVNTNQPDTITAAWKTAADAYAAKMHSGTLSGTRVITDALGSAVLNHGVSNYSTTRTLKRRGKKKSS